MAERHCEMDGLVVGQLGVLIDKLVKDGGHMAITTRRDGHEDQGGIGEGLIIVSYTNNVGLCVSAKGHTIGDAILRIVLYAATAGRPKAY